MQTILCASAFAQLSFAATSTDSLTGLMEDLSLRKTMSEPVIGGRVYLPFEEKTLDQLKKESKIIDDETTIPQVELILRQSMIENIPILLNLKIFRNSDQLLYGVEEGVIAFIYNKKEGNFSPTPINPLKPVFCIQGFAIKDEKRFFSTHINGDNNWEKKLLDVQSVQEFEKVLTEFDFPKVTLNLCAKDDDKKGCDPRNNEIKCFVDLLHFFSNYCEFQKGTSPTYIKKPVPFNICHFYVSTLREQKESFLGDFNTRKAKNPVVQKGNHHVNQ